MATYIAAATLPRRQTALSSLCKPVPLADSSSDLGQHLLTWPGRAELRRHFYYTQRGYFSKGVCSSPNPDILHRSQAAGSAVLSVGTSTGRRLCIMFLQRGSQRDYCLLPERSALEQHIHSPPDTSHVFAGGVLYPRREQRRTSCGTSANTFHLWDFHTWQLLLVLHNHLFFPM